MFRGIIVAVEWLPQFQKETTEYNREKAWVGTSHSDLPTAGHHMQM